MTVHPLEQQPYNNNTTTFGQDMNNSNDLPMQETNTSRHHHQQRAYSVTSMPSELQKSVLRHKEAEQQEKLRHNQPWWQYYYQLYHYHLPPGRKPTVFGPYLLLQTMGEGEFGKVKFGIEVKTGQEVAIKLIRKDSIDSSSRMTKVEREISVLRVLRHPNIVQLFDVIETEKYIGIILQCATGGELFDYILAHRYLKERDASRLFAQLISGVHYMHQKHIVHRDLKLENLLLDRHRNVLITDFGFANQFSSPQDDLMSTSCGSPCYAAPELVMNQGVYVGPAVDIWSCGVILFAMLCGYLPYDDDPANPESYNINLLYKYILNTPLIFPDYISDEACDLLSLMLVPDPEKRCSMETIMAHPWLSPHQHLFVFEEMEETEEEEEEQVVPPEQIRRNTIATTLTTQKEVKEEDEAVTIEKVEELQEVPEFSLENGQEEDHIMEEKEEEEEKEDIKEMDKTDTTTPTTTVQLPSPIALIEDEKDETTDDTQTTNDTENTTTDDTQMTEEKEETTEPTTIKEEEEEENIKDEKLHSVSPLPTSTTSTTIKARPKSTVVSTSTEKVLHFLSGHNNTPNNKRSTDEKRTRHMSLATTSLTTENHTPTVTTSPTTSTSILQSKFLSSIHHRKTPTTTTPPAELSTPPTPTSTSLSTPHPSKNTNNKRNVATTTTTPPPVRGTRRKTLSLLVNSMTDNKIPFANRRQSKTPPQPVEEQPARPSTTAQMMPSVSEHTIHTLTDKEKHRSAGKKLMDWFKKKPLSTIHRSTNQPSSDTTLLHGDRPGVTHATTTDPKLRIHHGAVDGEALTSRPPAQVFNEVKQTLKSLGLEFKRDGGEYKLKCARPKKPFHNNKSRSTTPVHGHGNQIQHNNNFRNLLRRPSASAATTETSTIYGDPNVDPGEEVRFSVELCKIKNLPGLYIVDMRRMRGNVWAYKFIYRTLLDTLNLGGKSGYLKTTTGNASTVTTTEESTTTSTSHHRMSTASSGGESSSVLLDENHTPPPPIAV